MNNARLWATLLLAWATLGAAAPAAEQPADASAQGAATQGEVQMAELQLAGRTVEGRLVFEDDKIVRIESIGAGVIGYGRANIREIRLFIIPESAFQERYGDYYHERAWGVDDAPAELARARQAYDQALLLAGTDEARKRLRAKLDVLAADREEWQLEVLRAQELARARHQTELARLETQLTKEKIEALRRQEQELQALRTAVRRMETDSRLLLRMVEDLQADVRELEEDVDDVRNLGNVFIRTSVFLDLRRSHERLEREVRRLERLVKQD